MFNTFFVAKFMTMSLVWSLYVCAILVVYNLNNYFVVTAQVFVCSAFLLQANGHPTKRIRLDVVMNKYIYCQGFFFLLSLQTTGYGWVVNEIKTRKITSWWRRFHSKAAKTFLCLETWNEAIQIILRNFNYPWFNICTNSNWMEVAIWTHHVRTNTKLCNTTLILRYYTNKVLSTLTNIDFIYFHDEALFI